MLRNFGVSPGIGPCSPRDADALLETALALQSGALPSRHRPLQGKNIGLLCDSRDEAMAAFDLAAHGLGAHVARIGLRLRDLHDPHDLKRIVAVLGKLYDVLLCQDEPPRLLCELCADSGVPVYGDVAATRERLAELARRLEGDAPAADKQRAVLQAALIHTFG